MATATAVLASANPGKAREFQALLAPLGIDLRLMGEFGVASPEETGLTFVENALIKARHAAGATGHPAIGDDSGLVVAALGGAPGLRSARYAGPDASAADNNAKLIAALNGVADRRAAFYCALVWLEGPLDPAPIIAIGEWHGVIVDAPRGANGFGYDPHFLVPALGATAAELAPGEKNRISHRGRACQQLVEQLAGRAGASNEKAGAGNEKACGSHGNAGGAT